jgi:hypothetical protein
MQPLPHLGTAVIAPAWFRCVAVNAMPNFTGVSAIPRFRDSFAALNFSISLRRSR